MTLRGMSVRIRKGPRYPLLLVQGDYIGGLSAETAQSEAPCHRVARYTGADPESFSRGGPTLSNKKPITHT